MVRCGYCEENITGEGDYVQCSNCNRKLHFKCTNITAATFKAMTTRQKGAWKCQLCKDKARQGPSGGERELSEDDKITEENEALKTATDSHVLSLNSELRRDIKDIKKTIKEYTASVEFMSKNYDNVNETLRNNNELLLKLTEQITDLKAQCAMKDKCIFNMQRQINHLEQEVIRNNIEVTNVPFEKEEDLLKVVKQIGETIGMQINNSDIDNIYRTNKKGTKKESKIIISLTNKLCKTNILSKSRTHGPIKVNTICKKLPSTTSERERNQIYNQTVYINSQLTATNRFLIWQAKNQAKAAGWKFVWVKDGKILARKDEGATVIRIVTADDICKII